ncbi:MAG: PAS domain S-box protein, partial [Planctomycetota bacterium]
PDGYMPCIDEAIEFFHPEDRPHLEAAINAAIKQAEPYDLELRFVTAKGRNLWTHTQCTPVVKDNRVVKLVGTFQDITRRKKAEYELQGRKAFLNTLLEAIPIPVFYKDRNGKYIGFNRAFELFFGITREQMIGKTVFDISPLELARTYHEKDSELFEKGGLQQYESQIKNTQGVVHDVIFNKAVFTDDRGNITGLIGTILDITARNRALEALLESDRILNATGKMGKIGGWEHNLETGKAVWTQALYDIIEIPYDQPPPGVDEHIAYYPVRDGKILEQAYSQAIENGTPFDLELQVYTSKKRLIWCRAQGQPVYKNGKCVAMRGIFKDITKRKLAENALRESQEKFHSMVENIGIGVSLISPEMEILELNRQMRAWFPDIDLKEHPTCFQGFNIPPGSKVCDYCPTIKTLRDGKVHESTTSTPLGDDIRNYRIVSSPILDAQGEVVAAIEMVEDITERMTLETQLHQAQKLETIGTLAGGIAHDFNNILYAILGNTEIAMGKISKDSEAMPRLQEVLIAGMRARDLVTQILSFSRQSLIDREPIRCFPLIKETLKLIHATLPSSIEIISTLKCECDTVLSSAIEIHQIVMNLCTNAAHAMKEGRGRIEIRLENQEVIGGEGTLSSPMTPGNYVVLTVSDTGCGIPKNLQGRIFDPFFTSKAPGTGTGLGLSVVYGIVKALGGSVEIKSEPDQGSVFKVFIPCIDAQPLPEQETKEVLPQGHGTLLVVDDEKVLAEMQALILKNLGYEVVTRISGREALETFAKDPYKFDLILSDQTMPEMTGDKLAEAILRIRPGIPVILCTGFSAQISEERIKKLGIKKLLIKPISRKILAESISEILVKNGFEGKK